MSWSNDHLPLLHESVRTNGRVPHSNNENGHGSIWRPKEVRNREEDAFANDARKVLQTRPSVLCSAGSGATSVFHDKHLVEKAHIQGVLFPWMPAYQVWWGLTVVGAIVTVFFGPFQIAFLEHELLVSGFRSPSALVELVLTTMFTVDIGVNFNLAFYKDEVMVFEKGQIFKEYMRRMFWVDAVGVFPFQATVLVWLGGTANISRQTALLVSLLRLLRFVRVHRLQKLSELLQYNARLSLLWFTLLRNLAAVLFTTHLAACTMYFLGRWHHFDESTTWLGPQVAHMTGVWDRYVTSLYWSVVTFCTVGYGDIVPVNALEQTACVIFMLFYIVVAAWIIGSITLLVVKNDEKTGEYRDSLQTLHQYSQMHHLDAALQNRLKQQLRLEFTNREISDESVLQHFPGTVRRHLLRHLYREPLLHTQLLTNIRPGFVDAFLASCTVEIWSPGEVLVERGSVVSDLFLLVGGMAEYSTSHYVALTTTTRNLKTPNASGDDPEDHWRSRKIEAGEFVGEIGFFTESPQVETVTCLTVCKTLTLSQASYKLLAQDHPGSVGKILQNLLTKVDEMQQVELPKKLSVLRAGSVFDLEGGYGAMLNRVDSSHDSENVSEALTAVKDLVQMHMSKQLDDQTTRFCFAASRGDTATIALMCDQGFDPNNADYDNRTALMVAAMKGNQDVVQRLLKYKADPNLTDMHGSTALLEAVKNGHQSTMQVLFDHGAELCLSESLAASVLCQAVFDGDILLLRRLLEAGIQVNAADYDKRTAAHIAAAEGNVAAIRVLAERGANLALEDRWGNTVQHEAERSNARQLLEFLQVNPPPSRKQAYV